VANLWNPNAGALGLEYLVTGPIEAGVAPGTPQVGQTLRSRSAETIASLQVANRSNTSELRPLFTLVEVFEEGDQYVPQASRLTVQYAPNADVLIGDWSGFPGGGVVNLWDYINTVPITRPTPGADGIQISTGPPDNIYVAHVASGAFPLTARVLRLRAFAALAVFAFPDIVYREFAVRLRHIPSGVWYTPPGSNVFAHIFGDVYGFDFGEINPVTRLPWSPQDVREFDGGDWAIQIESVASASAFSQVYDLVLHVDYLAVENRAAVATWERPTSPALIEETDALVELVAGDWSADWSKPSSGDFTFVWRNARDQLVNGSSPQATDIKWMGVTSDTGPAAPGPLPGEENGQRYSPVPGMRSSAGYVFGPDNLPLVGTVATPTKHSYKLGLIRSDSAASQDGQPYMGFFSLVGEVLWNSNFVAQQMTPSASDDYLGVQLVIAPPGSAIAPTLTGESTLTVTVHRQSDGLQMGGEFTITSTEVLALPAAGPFQYGHRLVSGFLDAGASLVSGTAYEVRLTVSGTTDDWAIPAPVAWDGSHSEGVVTFGGTTDAAEGAGGSTYLTDLADYPVTLFVQPDPVTNFVAEAAEYEFPDRGFFCSIEAIDLVRLSWSPPADLTGFARYVVERQTADQYEETVGEWELVAYSTAGTTTWTDVEAARGRPVRFRVRQETTAGAFSPWVTSDWITVDVIDCEVVFASNARPDLLVAYDRGEVIGYTFLRHEDDVFVAIYGRDDQVVFGSPNDRGISFGMELRVNLMQDPIGRPGVSVFAPLRAITAAIAEMPYVAVLDHTGHVFYSHLQVTEGTNAEPESWYLATANISTVQQTPTAVEF
jgi:hypothetical protein